MRYRILVFSILSMVAVLLSGCQPMQLMVGIAADMATAQPAMSAAEASGMAIPENYYSSHAGHERFGMIDLATGGGTDVGPIATTELTVSRTEWFSGNGAAYDGAYYMFLNKRLPMDGTPDQAQGHLTRLNIDTGATEIVGDVLPINLMAIEIDGCGHAFATGFTLSNDLGHLFGDTNLYSVNLNDASITLIGDTGLERIMDMSFDPDGTLWATTGNVLYTLDAETGAPSKVAEITGVENDNEIMGIGFTDNGELYATTPFSDGFYKLDPMSGVVQEVGRHGMTLLHGGDIPMTVGNAGCAD